MDGKQIFLTIIIALVVGILSSILTVLLMTNNIQATSCDGDSSCEATQLTTNVVQSSAGNSVQLSDNGDVTISASSDNGVVSIVGTLKTWGANFEEALLVGKPVVDIESVPLENPGTNKFSLIGSDGIYTTGKISSGALSRSKTGVEKGYVCFDSEGELYGQSAPCTQF